MFFHGDSTSLHTDSEEQPADHLCCAKALVSTWTTGLLKETRFSGPLTQDTRPLSWFHLVVRTEKAGNSEVPVLQGVDSL